MGHQVQRAMNGREALQLIHNTPPDLVLSDIMMPVLGGADLCRSLKAAPDTRRIPVILMSAGSQRLAAGAGADAFLAKPFDLEQLEAVVERWAPSR